MNGDKRWKDFDQPPRHESAAIRSASIIDDPDFTLKALQAGCFRFNDSTTQNWTLNQLYGWSKNPSTNQLELAKMKMETFQYSPDFLLGNSHNRALIAHVTPPLWIFDQTIEKISFYLESPDLSNDPHWQNAKGFSLDLRRLFFSHWGGINTPPGITPIYYSAQLQIRVQKIDTATGTPKIDPTTGKSYFLIGPYDPKTKQLIVTPIDHNIHYNIPFKPPILTTPNPGEDVKLLQVRVRCTMLGFIKQPSGVPHYGGGSWLIGNVCPLP